MNETVDRGGFCRRLMRRQAHAALATTLDSRPYASLVAVACDHDSSPLLLLSDLAQHSRNIAADNRVSLLFDGGGDPVPGGDPLAQPRLSLLGEASRCGDERLLARFVGRHPGAAVYTGSPASISTGRIRRRPSSRGFGRISWSRAERTASRRRGAALAAAEAESSRI